MTNGSITFGEYQQYVGNGLLGQPDYQMIFGAIQAQAQAQEQKKMPDGTKPVVICRGVVTEVKDMNEAQAVAESEAHSKSADAFILKPVRKVSPKRDVVTTDL